VKAAGDRRARAGHVACALAALALGACSRHAGAEAAPAPSAGAGASDPAAADPAARGAGSTSAGGGRAGFDERLLGGACAGCIAGQILDADGHPAKDAIVYVKSGLRPSKVAPPHRGNVIDQRDKAFTPHVLAVPVGSRVVFKNSDVVLHNVYSRSPIKTVDLGAFGQDQTRGTTFDEPGRVDIFCAIHTNMHAIILVLENPFFATTDDRGYFEIRGLPPGDYGLRIWTEQRQEIDARVELGAARPAILRSTLP
jgi:plastocyanin